MLAPILILCPGLPQVQRFKVLAVGGGILRGN